MKLDPIQGKHMIPQADREQAKLKKACEEFEAILTNYLFKSMRQTVSKAENEGRDQAQEIYEGMMDEAVANQLSHQSGLGLSRLLYQQLASQTKPKTDLIDLRGHASGVAETAETTGMTKAKQLRG